VGQVANRVAKTRPRTIDDLDFDPMLDERTEKQQRPSIAPAPNPT
jgi:hypothetical protein